MSTTETRNATLRTHTYTVAEGGKVRPEWVGREIPISNPEPNAGVANALASGAYENEAALVAAANQMRNIQLRDAARDEMAKEGATLESVIAAMAGVQMKAPRERTGEPKAKSSGEVKRAKAVAAKVDLTLTRAALDPAYAKKAIAAELFTREQIDAEAARIEGLDADKRPTLDATVAAIKAQV